MLAWQLAIMGMGLLRGLIDKSKKKEVRMCVIGLDNAGKTTILKALSKQETQLVQPT